MSTARSEAYGRVPSEDEEAKEEDISGVFSPQERTALKQEESATNQAGLIQPLEVDAFDDDAGLLDNTQSRFQWNDPPWILSVGLSIFLGVPILLSAIHLTWNLVGRIWPATLFALHLTLIVWAAKSQIPREERRRTTTFRHLIPSLLDILLFGSFYVGICNALIYAFFTEVDGTPVIEYGLERRRLVGIKSAGKLVAWTRFLMEAISFALVCYYRRYSRNLQDDTRLPTSCAAALVWYQQVATWPSGTRMRQLRILLRCVLWGVFILSVSLLIWCINSILVHWIAWPTPAQVGPRCDALDNTECFLPFPSFHHMIADPNSTTGWRVNLQSDVLPPLKGGLVMDPHFLNELDGFSTMSPLLFYMDGLKEADAAGNSTVRLQGSSNISLSVTEQSITLLLDVDARKLVHHSAEIDFLDPNHPLVLVFPGQPLQHNTHYALAVVHATHLNGSRILPSPGLTTLLTETNDNRSDKLRLERYTSKVIPALLDAAPWLDYHNDAELLQLLFDFQTISAESQLGPIRAVRDATLKVIDDPAWGDWVDHVRVIRKQEGICSKANATVARTIHGELDVPWFLEAFGQGHRGAFLDAHAIATGVPVMMGKARFVVHIPCSVRAAALNGTNATEIRSVMEFGHGLFYNRGEASDEFLLKMANKNGYVITAMDWRGMSSYDLLIVIQTLMSKPKRFQAIRDNLIMGYACKLALQHFSRNGMLDMPWFEFRTRFGQSHPAPLFQKRQPSFVFYGISQGGILGAGYSALSGPTGLIERTIVGSPGTPFALVMSRSLDFQGYDAILLLNFFNNRHVRFLLSLVQMAWDSVEGSGLLAPPITEPFPPVLIQAGLGDAVVTTIASEALARAYGASILPNNPRKEIYGISVASDYVENPPPAVLTELLYEQELSTLPVDDKFAKWNGVHYCVRQDPHLISQIAEFISNGTFVDACVTDSCRRINVTCGEAY